MSSISLSLKMLLAGSALAGLTLLACGEDSGGGGDEKEPTGKTKTDAGPKKDGGTGGKKDASAASAIPHAVEGDECTGLGGQCDSDTCDESPCYSKCTDGFYEACQSGKDLISLYTDGGVKIPTSVTTGDGTNYTVTDAGVTVKVGDASVAIPATECPDGFECSDLGALVMVPLKFCAAGFGPPACTTTQDCTDMGFKIATCGMVPVLGTMGCLQSCK
jgi:hypothetical protein